MVFVDLSGRTGGDDGNDGKQSKNPKRGPDDSDGSLPTWHHFDNVLNCPKFFFAALRAAIFFLVKSQNDFQGGGSA